MEALHGLLPHSASHKIIDSREKADPEDGDEAPDPEGSAMQDLMDVDPWFRHACLRAEHGDKTCVSQNMAKLIPRPSRSSDVVPGVLAKARKIEVKKKAIRELHHTFNVKLDQEKALSSICPGRQYVLQSPHLMHCRSLAMPSCAVTVALWDWTQLSV